MKNATQVKEVSRHTYRAAEFWALELADLIEALHRRGSRVSNVQIEKIGRHLVTDVILSAMRDMRSCNRKSSKVAPSLCR